MGTLVGHVAPGFAFLFLGLWHLFNHVKLHALNPNTYKSSPWFTSSLLNYLELYMIMVASSLSIAMELFIGPERHQPFDPDGTIPSNHLHNFEHSSISLSFFIYAAFSILLDKIQPKAKDGLTQLLLAFAFAQQFLLFRLHSADHMGVEGQYHLLLQLTVLISFLTTLIGMNFPKSFSLGFVRSLSIFFQGVWFILMGFMLWTPGLVPKGCFINHEEGHKVVRCINDHALHRAKSLVNIQFSWTFTLVVLFGIVFYLMINKAYVEEVKYRSLDSDEDSQDIESQKNNQSDSTNFFRIGRESVLLDMER